MNLLIEKLNVLLANLRPDMDSFRLLHGRGRCFPGFEYLNVDFFRPVLLVVLYKEPPPDLLSMIALHLESKLSDNLSCVLVQRRYLDNAPSEILLGALPGEAVARRGQLQFHLHLNAQQNTGFFLDMEAGRQWLEQNAANKRILNLFAYTCAFSVVALAAGAEKVVNVDMSSSALNLGRANHQLNKLPKERSEYLAENIMKSWGRIKKKGPFDLVIVDPPSYQKGSFIAEKDYGKIVRRLPELMPGGGLVLACLNAPELTEEFLKSQFQQQLPQAEFVCRIAPHDDFPDVNPQQQLKLLVFRLAVSKVLPV